QTLQSLLYMPYHTREVALRKLSDALAMPTFTEKMDQSLDFMTRVTQNVHLPDNRKKEAEQKARRLFQALTSVLTLHQNGTGLTEQKSLGILYSPVEMQPQFFRNTYWYVILLKADPTQWQTLLPALNGHVPDDVRIDPNPIHLFQP
ncbi:MAG: hypothetical protein AAB932_03385, partial [Patescibacteria group bacterium]